MTVALLYTPKSDCVVSAVKKITTGSIIGPAKTGPPDRLLRPCIIAILWLIRH